jgi:dynein heavy chain
MGVKAEFAQDLLLVDLLKLNLHEYTNEVVAIVDRAVKELNIEQTISRIEAEWMHLKFSFSGKPLTGLAASPSKEVDGKDAMAGWPMLVKPLELLATLEDHLLLLQNLASSRFAAYFQQSLDSWLERLLKIDATVTKWLEVQHVWSYVHAIFAASDDVRHQVRADLLHSPFEQFKALFTSPWPS